MKKSTLVRVNRINSTSIKMALGKTQNFMASSVQANAEN